MLAVSLWINGARSKVPKSFPRLFRPLVYARAFNSYSHPPTVGNIGLKKLSSLTSAGSRPTIFSLSEQLRSYTAISTSRRILAHTLEPRFFSSNSAQLPAHSAPLPVLSPPSVGRWLILSSALVFAIIVVGGVTRLTESGLSITEWRPITGILPPLSNAEWQVEFDKYKATPEFKL